jgi:hypothetical protein
MLELRSLARAPCAGQHSTATACRVNWLMHEVHTKNQGSSLVEPWYMCMQTWHGSSINA